MKTRLERAAKREGIPHAEFADGRYKSALTG
jgi:hypothetical protein